MWKITGTHCWNFDGAPINWNKPSFKIIVLVLEVYFESIYEFKTDMVQILLYKHITMFRRWELYISQ